MTSKTGGPRHLVVVTSKQEFGDAIRNRMVNPPKTEEAPKGELKKNKGPVAGDFTYTVDVSTDLSSTNRDALRQEIDNKDIDGFLWLDDKALADHTMTYTARKTNNFMEMGNLRSAVRDALMKQELRSHGLNDADLEHSLKSFNIETVEWSEGKERHSDEGVQFFSVLILCLAMYMTVMLYGVGVMRAVLQEKTNRVMEVLMSTCTATELMAGKIVGVAAVGVTQVAIWIGMGVLGGTLSGGFASAIRQANFSLATGIYFGVFFLLGYLLYSGMSAALGAMVSSEQEAQQLQFIIMLPQILSFFLVFRAMQAPADPLIVATSFIPFCAPQVMYARIVVQKPPFEQIAISIGLLIVGIAGMMWLCSRIYRVGVLMYGKKPTLPEIIKWIKYA
jgi:ABC-2 type transport system permease protein